MSQGDAFDYEQATWGREDVAPGDRTVAGHTLCEARRALPATGSVLELGCGAGRMLGGLRSLAPELGWVGIDVSRAALAVAARRFPQMDFRRLEDPAGRLPARDGEFAAVLVLDVLEHVEDPAATLAELRRVLAPGGRLHLHVPCEGDALSLWRWLPRPLRDLKRRYAGHVQRFRRREIASLLERSGFQAERTRYSLHLLGNLADVAVFCGIAALARGRRDRAALTTGDVVAGARRADAGVLARIAGLGVRGVDAALWLEACWLGRLPAWCLHVTARKL
ncbi:MAG: class I SAM-dependent methyltransferase [Myxococcota bacterium]